MQEVPYVYPAPSLVRSCDDSHDGRRLFRSDHHVRPFRKEGWEGKFKPDSAHRFEDSYRSACHLVYDSLREGFDWKPPAHLRDLVKWLNVIDFADYKSAEQTSAMKEPAIQANVFIENGGDAGHPNATHPFRAARSPAHIVAEKYDQTLTI